MRILRGVAALVVAGGLMACTSTPDAELLAAVKPTLETPVGVSGEYLTSCIEDRHRSGPVSRERVATQASYVPGYTYKFAEAIKRQKPIAEYAPRMRAYLAPIEYTGLFGSKVNQQLVCYYDLHDGQLRYLASAITDQDGRAERSNFIMAVSAAHARLTGKNIWATQVLGVLTN